MARSKLAGIHKGALQPSRDKDHSSNNLTFLSFEFKHRHADVHKYNMADFCNKGCSSSGARIKKRIKPIHNLANNISNMLKDGASDRTLDAYLQKFRQYIVYCDYVEVDPFTKEGFLAYCGNSGELWRLVRLGHEQKTFLFLYEDGDVLGISESSAQSRRAAIAAVLELCCVYSVKWQSGLRPFNVDSVPNEPYTEKEIRLILRRLQLFFFSLATQLIEYAEENPNQPPPEELEAELEIKQNGTSVTKTITSLDSTRQNKNRVQVTAPFNRCMHAGYFLFSYYTSFNDSSITDVRHPIDIQTTKREGRTVRHAKVRGWKGRSNKYVESLFSDADIDIEQLQEAKDDYAGYISSDVKDKRNGIQFIKTLVQLSKHYQAEAHGKLIYQLSVNGEVQSYRYRYDNDLSTLLNLLTDSRIRVVDHLISAFYLAKDGEQRYSIDMVSHPSGRFVRKKLLPMQKRGVGLMLVQYSYAAISCFTDLDLKNVILPLSFSPKNEEGNVTVTFQYLDGSDEAFDIPAKYKKFFEDVQSYAETRNPYKSKTLRHQNNPKRPAYLIPLGMRNVTYQWDGLTPIKGTSLADIGIGVNQFYVSLSSARFRASTANSEYRSEDGGLTVTQILQHQLNTMMTRYVNGHPDENNVITSQAIQILEKIAKGESVEEAKDNVRKKLNITVLTHDEYLSLRRPTNINGIYCNGEPDIEGAKDEHVAAKTFARKMGLNADGMDIGCYQYDLCVFCKSAKLVDDTEHVYKLLSFIECLEDAIDMYPESVDRLSNKINKFNELIESNVSAKVIQSAEKRLLNEGRYLMLQDSASVVVQFL